MILNQNSKEVLFQNEAIQGKTQDLTLSKFFAYCDHLLTWTEIADSLEKIQALSNLSEFKSLHEIVEDEK